MPWYKKQSLWHKVFPSDVIVNPGTAQYLKKAECGTQDSGQVLWHSSLLVWPTLFILLCWITCKDGYTSHAKPWLSSKCLSCVLLSSPSILFLLLFWSLLIDSVITSRHIIFRSLCPDITLYNFLKSSLTSPIAYWTSRIEWHVDILNSTCPKLNSSSSLPLPAFLLQVRIPPFL